MLEHDLSIQERVAAYGILGPMREAAFDRVVFTAAQLFRVPIAILALDDGEHLWFKAQVGLRLPELPRESTFYAALSDNAPLIVEDLSLDPRFSDDALVTGPPHLRFYAGAALVTPDHLRVGALCIADRVSKNVLNRQTDRLAQLARSTVLLLEDKRTMVT